MPNATLPWVISNEIWRARMVGMIAGSLLILIVGLAVWVFTRPAPPWFEFRELRAEYAQDQNKIHVFGQYYLDRLCENPKEYMVLRRDVIDARYRVFPSVVPLDQLALEVGLHEYSDTIELYEPLSNPTRSHVRITALCGGEFPPAVSPPVLVNVRRP